MTPDPVFGVLTREKFQELVAAPFGEATKAIRKVDPAWQRGPGEVPKWKVLCERRVMATETGFVDVEAADEQDARERAAALSIDDIAWSGDVDEIQDESHGKFYVAAVLDMPDDEAAS